MKIWVLYKQYVGVDYYDLDSAEVFRTEEDAERRMLDLQVGDDSIDIEDVTICKYDFE